MFKSFVALLSLGLVGGVFAHGVGSGNGSSKVKSFVVPHSTTGGDDAPAVVAALPAVANGTFNQILFEKGKTYNIFSPINFGSLNNVEIAIEGNLTLPTNVTAIQATVNDTTIYSGFWFIIKGTNVTLRGTTDPRWGWIDCHGQQWWDAVNQIARPHLFSVGATNLLVQNIKVWKPVAWTMSVSAHNAKILNNQFLSKSSTSSFPFNTDGFDVSGVDVFLQGNHIVNGDDCITINNGATNVHATDNYCEGGHGLSIGSLGKNGQVANVSNILFENTVMVNHLYGARFKSWAGGKGIAQNVTWRNIAFRNVPFPIYVTQNYWDQGVGPKPPVTANSTNTVVSNFKWENFVGTIEDVPYKEGSCISDPCWYAVPNATGKEVIIFDVSPGTANNLHAKNIFAKTETGARVAVMCNSTAITTDPGFVCQNGPFIPTRSGLGF